MSTMDRETENAKRIAARFSLQGRRALVTGGSLSIGREISLVLAEAGADVAVHFSRAADAAFGHPGAADETAAAIESLGRKALPIEADFGQSGEAARCVAATRTGLGGLDILVVCASIQYRVPFEEITAEQIERQLQINFKATVELLRAALPPMKDAGWGRVLTIGSINQTRPESVLAIYAALKSAQHNLCINLAREYAAFGVTLNNLSPGLVATERNRWRRADPTAWKEIEEGSSPMRRAGRPVEMAGAALLLCSEAGSFITGADLQVTGGRHL
jgi:NAD(P)-dependent dehydrogenase (short-subunit alcohol dehydrogenase family)